MLYKISVLNSEKYFMFRDINGLYGLVRTMKLIVFKCCSGAPCAKFNNGASGSLRRCIRR